MGKRTKQSDISHETVRHYLKIGHWIEVDKSTFQDRGIFAKLPEYYKPHHFKCRDCGVLETWTAEQQKWWYEEAGGHLQSIAVRCRKRRQARKADGG